MSCPVCTRPTDTRYRPFCSRRCADVDLARWLGGRHAIPGEPIGQGEDPDDTPPLAR